MNNRVLPQDKGLAQNSEKTELIILSSSVSHCLTASHKDCIGEYIDSSNKYRLKCLCPCHHSKKESAPADEFEPEADARRSSSNLTNHFPHGGLTTSGN